MSIVDTGRSDPLMATLKLLADPEEMQRRYAALQEAEARAKEVIALVGPANEIIAMRKQVGEELEGAKAAMGDARVQASMIVDTARRKAQEIEADIRAKVEENDASIAAIKAEEQAAMESAKQAARAAEQLKAEYLNKLLQVDNAKTQVVHEQEMLRSARVAFENRLQALNDVVEQFRSALGSV